MNACMLKHATFEEQDKARTQWFSQIEQRRKEREERERKKQEKVRFHHEYWGLDEHGRRLADRSLIVKAEDLPPEPPKEPRKG